MARCSRVSWLSWRTDGMALFRLRLRKDREIVLTGLGGLALAARTFASFACRFNVVGTSKELSRVFIPAQLPGTLNLDGWEATKALLRCFLGSGCLAQAFENARPQDVIGRGIRLAHNSLVHFFERDGKIAAALVVECP